MDTRLFRWMPLFLAGLVFFLGFFAYRASFQAPPQFDDYPNLASLESVVDARTALEFVVSGNAGPSGRPVSLASFLLHGMGWPASVPEMRRVNVLLHLLNSVLVFYLGYLLARHGARLSETLAAWAALGGSALWLLSPLLVSTSFVIVQRMTELSALFTLSGMIFYLKGRQVMVSGRTGVGRMVLGIVGFGLLAGLSKENGILLPMYVLVIETVLLEPLRERRHRWVRGILLGVPTALILLYLLTKLPAYAAGADMRGWSLEQRLMTEGRVLWRYLWLAFFPRQSALGPFNDDWPVSQDLLTPLTTLASLLGWGVVLVMIMAWRRHPRLRWLAFGLAWFLVGHLLESTIVPLEIYFEHRNYLPLVGVYLIVGFLPFLVGEYRRLVAVGLAGLVLMFGLVTWQTTRTWGKPVLAAELWVRQHPDSERAVLNLAASQVYELNEPGAAQQVVERFWRRNPRAANSGIQSLSMACGLAWDKAAIRSLYREVLMRAPEFRHNFGVPGALKELLKHIGEGNCRGGVDMAAFEALIDALLRNPEMTKIPNIVAHLYVMKARIDMENRSLERVMYWLDKAYAVTRGPLLLVDMGRILESAGRHDLALRKVDQALAHLPSHVIRRLRDWLVLKRYRRELLLRMGRAGAT